MTRPAAIMWFRNDLRLSDNPALAAANRHGGDIIPIFIWAPDEEGEWPPGAAARWWRHQSLTNLDKALRKNGSRLVVRRGGSLAELENIIEETGATGVFWNRRYEPAVTARDAMIKEALRSNGLEAQSCNGALWHEPWEIQNKSGQPYQVFTPYWKTCLERGDPDQPLQARRTLPTPEAWPESLAIDDLHLEPTIDWAGGLRNVWEPGEAGAERRLRRFLDHAFPEYSRNRDRPDLEGTSRLSPHLHFGEISPRQIWHGLKRHAEKQGWPASRWRCSQYLTEIGWREFAHHLLYHFPHTPREPLRPEFAKFPWRRGTALLRTWQKGRTGYPLVDAGMRELWATGWMHNRVRMLVASFLVKDLLIPWQEGAAWFWDTLVDADLANNTLGWQWTAGCGADAAPFFRVFNPISQAEKFDPHGEYIRRWVPELKELSDRWIASPWEASEDVLARAGICLGKDYPKPVVSHAIARQLALEAYQKIKG